MDGLEIAPEQLYQNAPLLDQVSTEWDGIRQRLASRLTEIGPFWGDDATGQSFLAKYWPTLERTLQAMRSAGQTHGQAATNIALWANNSMAAENAVAGMIPRQLG